MFKRLRDEIHQLALYVEPQGDFTEIVVIRMDAIEEAVSAWDRARQQQAKKRRRAARIRSKALEEKG